LCCKKPLFNIKVAVLDDFLYLAILHIKERILSKKIKERVIFYDIQSSLEFVIWPSLEFCLYCPMCMLMRYRGGFSPTLVTRSEDESVGGVEVGVVHSACRVNLSRLDFGALRMLTWSIPKLNFF
jgi:hypothetical protein